MRRHRRQRRGSNAVEFALTLPIFVIFLSGIADYGWYFTQQMRVTMVARDAARAGALVPLGAQVVQLAEAQGEASLQTAQLPGEVTCTLLGTSPDQRVTCTATVEFGALIGLVPIPRRLVERVTMRMEEQP